MERFDCTLSGFSFFVVYVIMCIALVVLTASQFSDVVEDARFSCWSPQICGKFLVQALHKSTLHWVLFAVEDIMELQPWVDVAKRLLYGQERKHFSSGTCARGCDADLAIRRHAALALFSKCFFKMLDVLFGQLR